MPVPFAPTVVCMCGCTQGLKAATGGPTDFDIFEKVDFAEKLSLGSKRSTTDVLRARLAERAAAAAAAAVITTSTSTNVPSTTLPSPSATGMNSGVELTTCGNAECTVTESGPPGFRCICATVAYCSKQCQLAHWPSHKVPCKAIRAATASATAAGTTAAPAVVTSSNAAVP
jgi:hypothetical protein